MNNAVVVAAAAVYLALYALHSNGNLWAEFYRARKAEESSINHVNQLLIAEIIKGNRVCAPHIS